MVQAKGKVYKKSFFDRLSNWQKVFWIGAITAIGFVLLTWLALTDIRDKLHLAKTENSGLSFNDRTRHLLQQLYLARYQLYKGAQDEETTRELKKEFEVIITLGNELFSDEKGGHVESAFSKAKSMLSSQFGSLEEQFDKMIQVLYQLQAEVSINSFIGIDPELLVHDLSDLKVREILGIQKSIDQSLIKIRESMGAKITESKWDDLVALRAVILRDLEFAEVKLLSILRLIKEKPIDHRALAESFALFSQSVEYFLDKLHDLDVNTAIDDKLFLTLASDQVLVMDKSFGFLDVNSDIQHRYLEERERALLWRQGALLLIAGFFFLFGLGSNLYFATETIRALNLLKNAADRISQGDFNANAPILHDDEVGKVCRAFNKMVETLRVHVEQSRAFQEATKQLAQGNFSARVAMHEEAGQEVQETARAFNKMAESFEQIVKRLQRLVLDLTASATQIAASSKKQEFMLLEQGGATKQIAMTATEISFTSKEFMNVMTEVMRTSDETSDLVSKSQQGLLRMEMAMHGMESAAMMISSKLSVLDEKIDFINAVVKTITEVSRQTDLLSLNAAIEAEKAGEMGESFSVIAREIRSLAVETAKAAAHIEKIVGEIVDSIRSSVIGVEDFGQEIGKGSKEVNVVSEQLGRIINQVKLLTDRYDTVGSGIASQTEAAEQIHEALQDLSQMAQDSTLSMSQFLTTIEQLDKAASDLRNTLETLRV